MTPKGRPTGSEHDESVLLLAEGAETGRILQEVARASARRAGAREAVVVARVEGDLRPVAAHGPPLASLTAAAVEAFERDATARRSDPVRERHAVAVPARSAGRVVAALAVAGDPEKMGPDVFDPEVLAGHAGLVALAMSRSDLGQGAAVFPDAFADLGAAQTPEAVATRVLDSIGQLMGLAGFVCFDDDGRLQVVRHRGLDRARLQEIVRGPEFRSLVAGWRDRPHPLDAPATVPVPEGAESVVCVPLRTARYEGLLAALATPDSVDTVVPVLEAFGRQASNALRSYRLMEEVDRRDREVDGLGQAVPSPVVVLDEANRFLRMNALACELFGLSGSFDSGRPAEGRLGDAALEQLLLGDRPGELEVELGVPRRRYHGHVAHVYDGSRVVRRILVLEDVSTQHESRRVKDDFVAVIGHELRTPLTLVKGFLETLAARGADLDDDQRAEFLRKASGQADRLHQLIEDMLFLSTERPSGSALDLARADTADLTRSIVDEFVARHPDRLIECVRVGGDTEAFVDVLRVQQVVRHLIDNAVKYSDGPVRVEVLGTDDGVEVAVVDEGPGIFSGDLERVFEPFRQLDASSTRNQGGTGLGLYVSRCLAEAMHGDISVDSRLGRGCRFALRLPRGAAVRSERRGATRDDARR